MWAGAASSRPRASCPRRTEATRGSSRPGTRERGSDPVPSLTGQVQYSRPSAAPWAGCCPWGGGGVPEGCTPKILHVTTPTKPWVYAAEAQRRERGGRKEAGRPSVEHEGRGARSAERRWMALGICASLGGGGVRSSGSPDPSAPGHLSPSPTSGCGWTAGPSMR